MPRLAFRSRDIWELEEMYIVSANRPKYKALFKYKKSQCPAQVLYFQVLKRDAVAVL